MLPAALVQRSKEAGLGFDFSLLLFHQARRVHKRFFGSQYLCILVDGFGFSFGVSSDRCSICRLSPILTRFSRTSMISASRIDSVIVEAFKAGASRSGH